MESWVLGSELFGTCNTSDVIQQLRMKCGMHGLVGSNGKSGGAIQERCSHDVTTKFRVGPRVARFEDRYVARQMGLDEIALRISADIRTCISSIAARTVAREEEVRVKRSPAWMVVAGAQAGSCDVFSATPLQPRNRSRRDASSLPPLPARDGKLDRRTVFGEQGCHHDGRCNPRRRAQLPDPAAWRGTRQRSPDVVPVCQ